MIEKLKTHLVITNINDEYKIKWCGSIAKAKPLVKNGMPVFVVISSKGRVELNTFNIKSVEDCAKRMTYPRGRKAFTTDTSYIYIKEENGYEMLLGKVIHNRIKDFREMYDAFERI